MTPPPLVRMEAPPPPIQTVHGADTAARSRRLHRSAGAAAAAAQGPVGAEREGRPAVTVQRRRLSGFGPVGRRRGHGPGVAHDRPGRARDRLQHHPVDRQRRARIPRPATFFAAAPSSLRLATAMAILRATRSRRRRSSGVWKANHTRFLRQNIQKESTAMQAAPAAQLKPIWSGPRSQAGWHHRHLGVHRSSSSCRSAHSTSCSPS